MGDAACGGGEGGGPYDVAVVGAGLSGLTAALHLTDPGAPRALRVVVLEGRGRVGGRLHCDAGVDLGASWSWSSDSLLRGLATRLGVGLFRQPAAGISLHEEEGGRVRTIGEGRSPCGPDGSRLAGSAVALVDRLAKELSDRGVEIRLNVPVARVVQHLEGAGGAGTIDVHVSHADGTVIATAASVVLAAPPRLLAERVVFEPTLPDRQAATMAATPTWMGDTGKIVFAYPSAFWLEAAPPLSGTAFSDIGPLRQIWDASDASSGVFALAGFIFPEEGTCTAESLGSHGERLGVGDDVAKAIAASPLLTAAQEQLVRLFGANAKAPTRVAVKSWAQDSFTSAAAPVPGGQLPFGSAGLQQPHHAVFFAGTETEQEHGHMEGAVAAGVRVAEQVARFFEKRRMLPK
jgi:monoamine oxidase